VGAPPRLEGHGGEGVIAGPVPTFDALAAAAPCSRCGQPIDPGDPRHVEPWGAAIRVSHAGGCPP